MTRSRARRSGRAVGAFLAAAVLLGLSATVARPVPAGADADPAADRQQLVYEINRARWSPALYGADAGLALGDVAARPPLSVDVALGASATFKSDEMATHGYFAHQSTVTGVWPNRLAREHGYPLPDEFPDDANNIESIHTGAAAPGDVLGSFASSPGHRSHLFGEGWFGTHTEIGVGRSATANYWAVHTAYRDPGARFLTGVVYDDADRDRRMDLGEGIAGVTVTVGGRSTVSNAGGGWSLQVEPGKHHVRVDDPDFGRPAWVTVRVSDWNVGVDFVAGKYRGIAYEYELCRGLEPTILGTSGDDVIMGTPGDDVIHGLGGDDRIEGRAGDDVICGGSGDDTLRGGGGDDVVGGGPGDDTLRGARGWDVLRGGAGADTCWAGESLGSC